MRGFDVVVVTCVVSEYKPGEKPIGIVAERFDWRFEASVRYRDVVPDTRGGISVFLRKAGG